MPPPKGPPRRGPRTEQEKNWAAVDDYTLSHLHPPSRHNHAALASILENSKAKGLPPIMSSPTMGKFLALQVALSGATHVLEVGTLGAYAACWIATQNPNVHVTTIEVDPGTAEVARENVRIAGVGGRVEVLVGSAVEILPGLKKEIEEGRRERFGFTFIDADKLNNWTYFDAAVGMSRPGAAVFIDNMSAGWLVKEEHQGFEHVVGARNAIEEVGRDERVDAVVVQVIGGDRHDGILMATVRT